MEKLEARKFSQTMKDGKRLCFVLVLVLPLAILIPILALVLVLVEMIEGVEPV